MVTEGNCEVNDKRAYKKKSLNCMCTYRNYANILDSQERNNKQFNWDGVFFFLRTSSNFLSAPLA